MEPTLLKNGDPCPSCDAPLRPRKVPTAKQREAAAHPSEPTPIPEHYDTASEDFRAEFGALHGCDHCGYQTRFPLDKPKAKAKAEAQ